MSSLWFLYETGPDIRVFQIFKKRESSRTTNMWA